MNWYKNIIILSSHNIEIPEEIYEDINEISNIVTNYRLNNKTKPEIIGQLSFINPYTKQKENINIVIVPQDQNFEESIATYSYQKNLITIYPYHLITNETNYNKLFNAYKTAINHEIIHSIDPKPKLNNYINSLNKKEYFSREDEFDAYSNQIKNDILNNLTLENKELLKNWLISPDILNLPIFMQHYDNIIKYWLDNKPEYIKTLKIRLYNDFFGG